VVDMKGAFAGERVVAAVVLGTVILYSSVPVYSFELKSSSQFLWGDNQLGDSEPIVAEYLRISSDRDEKGFKVTGYGRATKDLGGNDTGDTEFRDDGTLGRLYYLYADYSPVENAGLRVGRHYVNYTADSSVIDGLSLELNNIGNRIGISAAAGSDVSFNLDKDYSTDQFIFTAIDIHLENTGPHQLGVSYAKKYDGKAVAMENIGFNAMTTYKSLSPYVKVVYAYLVDTIEELQIGADLFYNTNFTLKGEYYQSYPSFESTSIYSVFAVDRYSEYLLQADYFFDAPFVLSTTYTRQMYGEDENTDVYTVGLVTTYFKKLKLNCSTDLRLGYGGRLWGLEAYGDYRIKNNFIISAGVQNDEYDRIEAELTEKSAQRFWVGVRYAAMEKLSINARVENNTNQNFSQRSLGRLTFDYKM